MSKKLWWILSAKILIQLWHKYLHNIHFSKYIVQILLNKNKLSINQMATIQFIHGIVKTT